MEKVIDFLKKFGFWIGIGVVALGAVGFYAIAVRGQAEAFEERLAEAERLQRNIRSQDEGPETPNEKFIERAREEARRVEEEIERLQRTIVSQRRRNHTKLFWHRDDPMRTPVRDRTTWTNLHRRYVRELRDQVYESGLGSEGLVALTVDRAELPSWPAIRNDQVHFWLTKDLLHLLMNQAEKDLRGLLREHDDNRLESPLDVVRNPEPGEISLTLQTMEKDELAAILEDIIVNENQEDLAKVFERHGVLQDIRSVIETDYQAEFASWLRNTHDRSDLVDYIEDVRWLRFRDDLIGLYRNHGFDELAAKLQDWGPDSPRILSDDLRGPNWRPLRLAQAIEASVSITSEKDLNTVLASHRPRIVAIDRLNIPRPVVFEETAPRETRRGMRYMDDDYDLYDDDDDFGRPGERGERARGMPGVYNALPFDMAVTIEWRRIPILIRRLLRSDWRIEIDSMNIAKTEFRPRTDDRRRPMDMDFDIDLDEDDPDFLDEGFRPPTRRRGLSPPRSGAEAPTRRRTDATGVAGPSRSLEDDPDLLQEEERPETMAPPSNYVRLELSGEARQFYPLWADLNPDEAKALEERFQR